MNGDGVHHVVHPEDDEHLGGRDVHNSGDETDDDTEPDVDHARTARDGHEAAQHAVVHPSRFHLLIRDEVVQEHDRRPTHRGAQGGRHDTLRGENAGSTLKRHRRHAVKSVPAEPHEEGSNRLEHGRLHRHLHHDVAVVPAHPRADRHAGNESREPSGHVHHARARVVHGSHAQEKLVRSRQGRRPALLGPAPVRHHRVHQRSDDHGIHGVRFELEALRDRAGDDGGARGREGEAVEPLGVLVRLHVEHVLVVEVHHLCEGLRAEREIGRADELALPAVQERKAE